MKNNIITIMKKELARFFGDKRLVFTTVLLPGLMIYVIYSLMGSNIMTNLMAEDGENPVVYIVNKPEELEDALHTTISAEWKELSPDNADRDKICSQIADKQADALVVFPEKFTEQVKAYDVASGESAPNVEVYYNSANAKSKSFKQELVELLDVYESSMANKLDVNGGDTEYDCASDRDMTGQIFSMLLPMLLMIFLYSGCVAVAPESIAGEKERGTVATLLVTPMKRSDLALGKVFSLSIIALLSGFSSFLGTFLSLPNLMKGNNLELDSSVYVMSDFLLLLGIMLSSVLALVAVISVISATAKSVKEAGTAVSPLMVVIMFISFMPAFGGDGPKQLYWFFIPIYNSVQSMQGIFSFSYEPVQVAVTILANLAAAGILTYVLTKLFDSEKVMFAK